MLKISSKIEEKLKCKHNITVDEVIEAIGNAKGRPIEDTAEDHKTNPPSDWFISQTDKGRTLKIVIIFRNDDVYLKTAFDAKLSHIKLFEELNAESMDSCD